MREFKAFQITENNVDAFKITNENSLLNHFRDELTWFYEFYVSIANTGLYVMRQNYI
jgi:hypothetical protein